MKIFLSLIFLFSSVANAENCTAVIKDSKTNQEYEIFTRTSYSNQSACDIARFDCNSILSQSKSQGKYQNAECVIKSTPASNVVVCLTDMYDFMARYIRTFAAPGVNSIDSCNNSYNFCQFEAIRFPNYGLRCIVRGIIDTGSTTPAPNPQPTPTPNQSAECKVNRLDENGVFLQNYIGKVIGPLNRDLREMACRQALDFCSADLKGKETCNILANK